MFYTFQLRVRFELCECGCFVTLGRDIRNFPHNPLEFGRLLRLLLVVKGDLLAELPRIGHRGFLEWMTFLLSDRNFFHLMIPKRCSHLCLGKLLITFPISNAINSFNHFLAYKNHSALNPMNDPSFFILIRNRCRNLCALLPPPLQFHHRPCVRFLFFLGFSPSTQNLHCLIEKSHFSFTTKKDKTHLFFPSANRKIIAPLLI